jgi:outer membrane protein OmpA-like peptidoglycan-associated protein
VNAKSSCRTIAAAVTVILSGCAVIQSGAVPAKYSFAYQADNREEIGLVQVFDDGAQTYLQLSAAGDPTTRVLDENGRYTTPIRNGAFLVVPGVHSTLTVERAEGVSHVSREGRAPRLAAKEEGEDPRPAPHAVAMPSVGAATIAPADPVQGGQIAATLQSVAPPAGAALAGMQATVLQLKSEVQALEREIADEQEALGQMRQLLARERRTETFVVHFANNSARAELSQQEIASIVTVGKNAQGLIIEGYTDAFYANDAGANLARARARNVAEILAGGGIKPDAMNIEFHAAGGFARENTSDEGKAFNRRVAISFRFPETISSD